MTALAEHVWTPTALPPAIARGDGPELRELRYFASVARAGNLGRAAQELGITPAAISYQLRKLEDGLGTQLLLRHSRGVTLTPSGASLLERLDTILQLLAAPLARAEGPETARGTVSLALPAEIGPLLAPPLVAEFRRRWPLATLDIQESAGGALESWVLGHKADVAIVQDPPVLQELRFESLATEQLGVVVSPQSALAESSRAVPLRDLRQMQLILPNPQHWIRRVLARAGLQRGVQIEPALQLDSVSLTKELVRSGQGCTVLPSAAVRGELDRGALVFRPIDQPPLSVTHAIAIRRACTDPVIAGFVAALRDVIRSLVSGGAWSGAKAVEPKAKAPPAQPGRPAPFEAGRAQAVKAMSRNLEVLEAD